MWYIVWCVRGAGIGDVAKSAVGVCGLVGSVIYICGVVV